MRPNATQRAMQSHQEAKTVGHGSSIPLAAGCLLAAMALITTSCASLYKVKPVALLPRMPADSATADLGMISFRAAPLLTDEEGHELFESNLLLAGLLPVRVEIAHNSGEAVDLKQIRFH